MKKYILIIVFFNAVFFEANSQEMALTPTKIVSSNPEKYCDGDTPGEKTNAQFVFNRIPFSDQLNNMDGVKINGFFNNQVEKKYYLFNDTYTYDVPLGPGSLSTRTVIEKPVIYSAVNKLYKYYKNECKKGRISKELAEKQYSHVLDVGLSVLYNESDNFENALKSNKELSRLNTVFQNTKLVD